MKRFWNNVAVVETDDGYGITLDGRAVRTPARAELLAPSKELADAIAHEWRGCGETVDPRQMPLTGLANAAIDRVAADPEAFSTGLAQYAQGDLLCYRAEGPASLVARQSETWNALLDWARRRYDVDFACTAGITHVPQAEATVARLTHAVAVLDPYRLAALSPLVTIGGSLVVALAVLEQAVPPETAWEAVSLDDRWQLEQWGADSEAEAALDLRRRDFLSAAQFLSLL